jgi:hypothetical protein
LIGHFLCIGERPERILDLNPWLRLEGVYIARDIEVEFVFLDFIEANGADVLQQLVGIGVNRDKFVAYFDYVLTIVFGAAPRLGNPLVPLGFSSLTSAVSAADLSPLVLAASRLIRATAI